MGLPLTTPQLLCFWTPLHTPRHVPLVSRLLQNSARTNSQNNHLIITFVTNVIMRLIFTFVPNWRCFNSALKAVYLRFSAVFAFETDDCGRLVG